jgi:hypothetical protein
VEAEETTTPGTEDDANAERDNSQWAIDIAWLEGNNRSFQAMAENCLCGKCRKGLKAGMTTKGLLSAAKECSGHSTTYITGDLPVMESIFRLFLAEGNGKLDLIELGRRLGDRRGVDTYRTSVAMLWRLLRADQHYGVRQA